MAMRELIKETQGGQGVTREGMVLGTSVCEPTDCPASPGDDDIPVCELTIQTTQQDENGTDKYTERDCRTGRSPMDNQR